MPSQQVFDPARMTKMYKAREIGATIGVRIDPATKMTILNGEITTGISTKELMGREETRDAIGMIGGIGIVNPEIVEVTVLPHDLGQGHLSRKVVIKRKKKGDHVNGRWTEDIKKRDGGWINLVFVFCISIGQPEVAGVWGKLCF